MAASTDNSVESDETTTENAEFRLTLNVDISDIGPCKKHIRVTVPKEDIAHFHNQAIGELVSTANVPGFRQGHVPKALVERRFRDDLRMQVKQQVLVESLEQLAEDNDLDPINEPDIDIETIEIPEDGDFEFEFDIEVRPEFELPEYKGIQLNRPVQEITDEAIAEYQSRFLGQYELSEPVDAPAETGDTLVLNMCFEHNGELLGKANEISTQLRPALRFRDAAVDNFGELMAGVSQGDSRQTQVEVSRESELVEMRGETVDVDFEVESVRRSTPPEMDRDFLQRVGVETEEELQQLFRGILERQVTYQQRQAVRSQVLEKITESANWDLPEQLVMRQTENALRREILEMQQAGFTPDDIVQRENELRQNAISSTRQALKEHFVLDKIATEEKLEVGPQDMEEEIQAMATQSGESPRRVRARLVKSGMVENLEAQIRERMAVDVMIEHAEFVDVPAEGEFDTNVTAIPISVCGDAPTVSDSTEEPGETESAE